MNLFNKILKKNNCKWYYDIPSSEKFLSAKKARYLDADKVASYIDLLKDNNDEISIEVSNESKYITQISIWGESSKTAKIERVEPRKCASYLLSANKNDIKKLVRKIELLAENPSDFGLVLKGWE